MKSINVQALGFSLAVFGAVGMLVMAILANAGYYLDAWSIMMQFHMFADLSVMGIVAGMIEAALWSYVSGVFIATVYNRLSS